MLTLKLSRQSSGIKIHGDVSELAVPNKNNKFINLTPVVEPIPRTHNPLAFKVVAILTTSMLMVVALYVVH
jgi:hypothetical protein